MEFGFDPWASPTGISDAEHMFREDSSSIGTGTGTGTGTGSSVIHKSGVPRPYPNAINQPQLQSQNQRQSSRSAVKQRQEYRDMLERRKNRTATRTPASVSPTPTEESKSESESKHIIPGVSKMTMRQMLSVIFSAFWDRADLYTDVLALVHDEPNDRQLKTAFLRQGRLVLATPIESPDDMTLISAGVRGLIGAPGRQNVGPGSTISIVQAGTPVSRKAKLKFQAVSLAYELLKDGAKRTTYDEWKLWNSRLPPPVKNIESQLSESSDQSDSGSDNPSNGSLNYKPSTTTSIEDKSFPSILKKSTKTRRRRLRRAPKAPTIRSDRRISWNELVEELVITESLPHYDPLIDCNPEPKLNNPNAQFQGFPDPYGNSAEDWFGAVDNQSQFSDFQQSQSNTNTGASGNLRALNGQVALFAQAADMGFGDNTNVNNFDSLNSQTVVTTINNNSTSKASIVFEDSYNPNDSLMVILDGPTSPEKKSKNKKKNMDNNENCAGNSLNGFPQQSWNKPSQTKGFSNNLIAHQDQQATASLPLHPTGEQVETHSTTRSMNTVSAISPPVSQPASPLNNYTPSETATPVLPKNPDIEHDDGGSLTDGSYQSHDFTASWGSVPTIELEQGDDCDIGRTVDLAKGFQMTLSNYINSAVDDMKEGLQLMGKQWGELTSAGPSGADSRNFFFLETSELDAMMGLLQKEIETLPTPSSNVDTCSPVNACKSVRPPSVERSPSQQKRFFGNLFSKSS